MTPGDVKTENVRLTARAIIKKAGAVNAAAALLALGVSAAFGREEVTGCAVGLFIGALSFTLLLRTALTGVSLKPEEIPGFIGRRYSARFALTALMLVAALMTLKVSPVPLVLAYALTHLCTIGAMMLVLRGNGTGAGLKEGVS